MAPKTIPPLKKFIIVGGVLAVLQVIAIALLSNGTTGGERSPDKAIDEAITKSGGIDPSRQQMVKIQLSIADYMTKHAGKPPANLSELSPLYFESVPIDPSTGKQFKYRVEGARYFLGDQGTASPLPHQQAKGSGTPSSKEPSGSAVTDAQKDALLDSLSDNSGEKSPIYDPSTKRDPFKPFDLAPKRQGDEIKTPLEGFPLEQLKYSAYLQSESEPKALVENSAGRGFTVTKGAKIGPNNGEITEILPEKIIVVETQIDFTGEKRTRTFEMYIGVRNDSHSGSALRKK